MTERLTKQLNVAIADRELRQLEAAARILGQERTAFVRMALRVVSERVLEDEADDE